LEEAATDSTRYFVGRRKSSVAKVFLLKVPTSPSYSHSSLQMLKGTSFPDPHFFPGREGEIIINSTFGWNYFVLNGEGQYYYEAIEPLIRFYESSNSSEKHSFHIIARVQGGGLSGQAGAIRFGLVRALCSEFPECRSDFRSFGFLTSDSRRKERKKYGLKKARKAPQFSKR